MVNSADPGLPAAQTLRRGLAILRLLARSQFGGLRVGDIARRLQLTKATAVRLTQALMDESFVVHDTQTRCYRLGPEALAIGLAAEPNYAIQRFAAPVVHALAIETGDCACFSVRQENDAVCLSVHEGHTPLPSAALRIGDRYPLGVSSAGLAMLAGLGEANARAVLHANRERIEKAYVHLPVHVIEQLLADARGRGYALVPGLLLPGIWAIGVPLYDSAGQPVAALSVAATQSRMGPMRCTVLGERMRRLSIEVMERLAATQDADHGFCQSPPARDWLPRAIHI